MADARVLGVDACPGGWVGLALRAGTRAYFAPTIGELVSAADVDQMVSVVGIDIPIGLPDTGRRRADVLAREIVGARRSSVFMTPVRDSLLAPDHASAVAINRRLAGEGVSMQAYRLRARILEVDAWLRNALGADRPVLEVHPEVCFATLAGAALETRKSTWAGVEQRRRLLAGAGVELVGDLGATGAVAGVDDVLDAAAVAWTARRYVRGGATSLPDPPEVFVDGIPSAIWV
jgi:predicted RNase H-like nuclease